jgi:UDP-N-acetylmuramoyl-tripeptide--D-alanyl-D-alanine ligase
MSLWTSQEIAEVCGGKCSGSWTAGRVVLDSRKIRRGDLFIALPGERVDGHEFVADAIGKGASGAVVYRECDAVDADRLVIVPNVLEALQKLGKAARHRSQAKVAGITGSVGKTSAKEMLKTIFEQQFVTYATEGNYNNHIGLPWMLANMPKHTEVAVIEMGMNHAGEIDVLTRIAEPDAALITAVEAVHIEFFESVEGIADAKAEIMAGIRHSGSVVLPADNPHFARLKSRADEYGIAYISFGYSKEADYRVIKNEYSTHGQLVAVEIKNKRYDYTVGALGEHWGVLSAGVLALGVLCGADIVKACESLAGFTEPPGRGQLRNIVLPQGNISVIDDSYNASPASVKAALRRMQAMPCSGRKILALGDMLELGEQAPQMHADLADDIAAAGIDSVYTAGQLSRYLHDSLPDTLRGNHAEDSKKLVEPIENRLNEGDVLLVKGSRGSRMERIIVALEDAAGKSKNRW